MTYPMHIFKRDYRNTKWYKLHMPWDATPPATLSARRMTNVLPYWQFTSWEQPPKIGDTFVVAQTERNGEDCEGGAMTIVDLQPTATLSAQSVAVIREALTDYEYAKRAFYDGDERAIADADAAKVARAELTALTQRTSAQGEG